MNLRLLFQKIQVLNWAKQNIELKELEKNISEKYLKILEDFVSKNYICLENNKLKITKKGYEFINKLQEFIEWQNG